MLFLLKVYIDKPAQTSNKEFYSVWLKESQAALEAVKGGAIKGIWKAAGQPIVIAIMDLPNHDVLDQAIHQLPIWKLGYSHVAKDIEIIPIRPYENWAEDLKSLAEG